MNNPFKQVDDFIEGWKAERDFKANKSVNEGSKEYNRVYSEQYHKAECKTRQDLEREGQ